MAENSLPPQTEFPFYPWHPGPQSATAISTTFFDAGLYTPLTTTQLINITTLNTACPLCHLDFTKFRPAFACKRFDPTPAYPPTTICIIPATELLTHLKLISKLHPPHNSPNPLHKHKTPIPHPSKNILSQPTNNTHHNNPIQTPFTITHTHPTKTIS